ncbi:MAG: Phosphocholine transferase AnkX [Wolbachia endosymbiont of Ctenocephalides orientis wCori]|nr:MAG: Phosphocholine transferase AnkX [Wolbachia endosymbiont of Ctenocephalides orientis wCori]
MTKQISDISEHNNLFGSKLTANQQRLSDELEDIVYFEKPVPNNGNCNHVHIDHIADKLERFLRKNEHNEDLKYVLNLQRGGSQSTVLHDIGHSSAGIRYYAFLDDLDSFKMLLGAGANPNIKNSNGETALETAIKSECYHITELLLNEEQKELKKELDNLLEHANFWSRSREHEKFHEYYTDDENVTDIREFLKRHEGNKDLKCILNLQTGQFGSTVLHDIVKYDAEVVDLLLKAGADPSIQDTEGKTPMHYAAEYGCSESIDVLILSNKANPNIVDERGNTPLHYAIAHGDTHSAESLVKAGTTNVNIVHQDTGETPIFDAVEAERDSGRIAELMITDEKVDLNIKNAEGMSVLHKAALCGRSSTVDLLLHKINPFDLDHAKRSPLHLAALNNLSIENNSSDESRENGFDYRSIETPDANITAIIGSLVGECIRIINIKLDRDGVKDPGLRGKKLDYAREEYINAKDKNGNTPLFYAAESGKINVVNRLLDEGAKIDVINKEGFTSLHFAVKNRSLDLLKALLHEVKVNDREGAHIQEIDLKAKHLLQLKDNKGNTLLHHAIKWGCGEEILNFLVQHGVDINAPNKNGVAPIHIAAKYGSHSQIKFFIDKKADLNLRCGKLSSSTIEDIGKEREFSGDSLKTYTNIQNGSLDASEDGRGCSPLHIAIKRALENNWNETKRERLKIVKDLASVSDLAFLIMPEGIDEWSTWRSGEIIQILQDEIESRKGTKLPNAPIENKEARAPIFYDSFYSEIGSYVTEPDLFSDLSGEPKKSYKLEVWDESDDGSRSNWTSGELKGTFELLQNQKEKLDKFLFKVSEASSMSKLAEIVDQALKSGVTINSAGRNHQTFTSAIVDKVGSLEIGKKEGDEVVASMICKLISKGGYISDKDKFWGLEYVYRDYNKDIAKAETEFKEYYNSLKKAAEEAVNEEGSLEELKIDNTTCYIKYSESSLVNVAKIAEEAKKIGFKEGNVIFSQNVVKIGESEVSVEIKDGVRNYTDLSDNSDITLTFSTSLGELKVRLRPNANNRGKVTVEVFDQDKFNRLKNIGEKIGENCMLGGLCVYEAIDQGGFHNLPYKDSKKTAEETNAVNAMDWVVKAPNQNDSWLNSVSVEKVVEKQSCERGI